MGKIGQIIGALTRKTRLQKDIIKVNAKRPDINQTLFNFSEKTTSTTEAFAKTAKHESLYERLAKAHYERSYNSKMIDPPKDYTPEQVRQFRIKQGTNAWQNLRDNINNKLNIAHRQIEGQEFNKRLGNVPPDFMKNENFVNPFDTDALRNYLEKNNFEKIRKTRDFKIFSDVLKKDATKLKAGNLQKELPLNGFSKEEAEKFLKLSETSEYKQLEKVLSEMFKK